MQSVIFCFGDSITHGAHDLEKGGWANRLRIYWHEQELKNPALDVGVRPLGIPGETTEGLLKRFESETLARLKPNAENIFIFAFGANDCAFLTKEKRFAVDIGAFERNLKTVIANARKFGSKIYFLTITPVVDEITGPAGENGKSRLNKYVDSYNERIKKIAASESVELIDINAKFKKQDYSKLLSEDGLHPNAEGHRVIFELVKTF
jgi:lysophospholipase L1-like esterase